MIFPASHLNRPNAVIQAKLDPEDVRVGSLIYKLRQILPEGSEQPGIFEELLETLSAKMKFVIVGFPVDEGVRRNGGRPGAAAGPDAIRERLYRFTPDPRTFSESIDLWSTVADLGNISAIDGLEKTQERLGDVVAWALRNNLIPIVLGGGHETAYGHYLGYKKCGKTVQVLNLDAHLDVRPYEKGAHSGSPFRQMLDDSLSMVTQYNVVGVQPHSCASKHLEFVENQGSVLFRNNDLTDIRQLIEKEVPLYLSLDLDVLDWTVAPGVSAPAVDGFSVSELNTLVQEILGNANISSFDIVELNPKFDQDGSTARVAAWIIYQLISTLGQRF